MPSSPGTKERLDDYLVRCGLAESPEQAMRLILAGEVKIGTAVWDKPGAILPQDAVVAMKERPRYVGRGGLKLEAALDAFGIFPAGKICFDAGASTGGFTDCLLQRGAAKVFAFDVGTNQLAWKLRSDERVVVREKFNVRYLSPEDVEEEVDLMVLDVSFISLTLILPPCWQILKPAGDVLCLIKPQFELERDQIGRGGIVRQPDLRRRAVSKIQHFAQTQLGARWCGVIDSVIAGADGNREYFAWLQPT